MEFVLGMLIGVVLVWIVVFIRDIRKTVGNLRVDNSDPDSQPYLFLEMTKPMCEIQKRRSVILQVNLKGYITHD